MNAEDVLLYGHRTVQSTLEAFAGDTSATGACGWWSVKDIVAHLASYEGLLVDILAAETRARAGTEPGATAETGTGATAETSAGADAVATPHLDAYLSDHASFNDTQVGLRSARSLDEVVAEYDAAYARAAALVATIPEVARHRKALLPWYGEEYDLEDFLVYQYYGHKREHTAQIAAFGDRYLVDTAPPPT